MIKIYEEELKDMKELPISGFNNGGIIYIKDNNTLYKIYDLPIFIKEKEQNIDYMLKTGFIENSGTPIEKILMNESFIGFSMQYYNNCKSFRELIYDYTITDEEKKLYVTDIYKQIRELHSKGIILHDIHLDNMIANDRGHLIDLDEVVLPGNELKFKQYYTISKNKKTPYKNICTIETDNIKATISSLSILYNYDFETALIKSGGLQEFLEDYNKFFPKDIIEYLKMIFEMNCNIYFDEILNHLNNAQFNTNKKVRK